MSAKKNDKKASFTVHTDKHLVLFADNLYAIRRSDGLNLLRFTSMMPGPEGHCEEQACLMIPDQSLKSMIDALCRVCNHYPEKGKTVKKTTKKGTKR